MPRSLLEQLDANATLNLLGDELGDEVVVATDFVRALESMRSVRVDRQRLNELNRAAARACVSRIMQINPYLEVAPERLNALASVYCETMDRILAGAAPETVLREVHFPNLRSWVAGLYPESARESLRHARRLNPLAYSEYSAELQLAVLRVEPDRIDGSVLDLGCGARATLVRELRARGIDAAGVDRMLEESGPGLIRAAWSEFEFPRAHYSLVVSHLAFSSHYRYQVQTAGSALASYGLLYLRILASLRSGGCFRYVPALPHEEARLDRDEWSVERWPVAAGVDAAAVTRRRG